MTTAVQPMFQFFEPLPADEYAALKADIAKRGVLVPIEYDEEGNILDGHHRYQICRELGIKDFPRVVRRFSSLEEKEEHIVTLNVRRRHLTNEQKRKWAEWFLRRHPEWSNRRVAAEVGLSDPTVAKVREELETNGELLKISSRVGKDGKTRPSTQPKPASPPSIFATSDDQAKRAQRALVTLGEQAPPKMLEVKRAERIARETAAERRRAEPIEAATIHTGSIDIRHGDFRQVLNDIEPGTVDAIITDPPYPGEYVDLFTDLSHLAARILKPSGVLVVMCGQYYLPDYITRLSTAMRYRWTAAYIAQGARTRVHASRVGTGWKPLLVYQRHDAQDVPFLTDDLFDASTTGDAIASRRFHHWGQSEPGVAEIVERFTEQGALVVDPFLGGGTTAVVCRDLGRRFIGCDIDAAAVATTRERMS